MACQKVQPNVSHQDWYSGTFSYFISCKPGKAFVPTVLLMFSVNSAFSSQMPFQFTQCDGSPLKWSLSMEHQADPSTNKDSMCYCVHIRVSLGEGRGDSLPPPHTWTDSLIAYIFQECLEERITKAVVLALGEGILFFGRQSLKEGLFHRKARDVTFSRPSHLGQETGSGEDDSQYGTGGLPSHWRCSGEKEDESPRTRMSLREKEDQPDPCCNIQHQQVNAWHRRGWV